MSSVVVRPILIGEVGAAAQLVYAGSLSPCQVLVFRHFQHTGGWCAEIESVHVRADRRSEGIGAMMLKSADLFATNRGCYRIQLTSRKVRHDAHRFYLDNGYELTSEGFKKSLGVDLA